MYKRQLFALLPLLLGNRWAGLAGVFAMGLLMYLLNTPAQMHALSLAAVSYTHLDVYKRQATSGPTARWMRAMPSLPKPAHLSLIHI